MNLLVVVKTYLDYVDKGRVDVVPVEVVNFKIEWSGTEEDHFIFGKFRDEYEIANWLADSVPCENWRCWATNAKCDISYSSVN